MRFSPELRESSGYPRESHAFHAQPEELPSCGICRLFYSAQPRSGIASPATRRNNADHHSSRAQSAHSHQAGAPVPMVAPRVLRASYGSIDYGKIRAQRAGGGGKMVGCGRVSLHSERRAQHHEPAAAIEGNLCVDRKSTRLNSSHMSISYAVFCLKKKKK